MCLSTKGKNVLQMAVVHQANYLALETEACANITLRTEAPFTPSPSPLWGLSSCPAVLCVLDQPMLCYVGC